MLLKSQNNMLINLKQSLNKKIIMGIYKDSLPPTIIKGHHHYNHQINYFEQQHQQVRQYNNCNKSNSSNYCFFGTPSINNKKQNIINKTGFTRQQFSIESSSSSTQSSKTSLKNRKMVKKKQFIIIDFVGHYS